MVSTNGEVIGTECSHHLCSQHSCSEVGILLFITRQLFAQPRGNLFEDYKEILVLHIIKFETHSKLFLVTRSEAWILRNREYVPHSERDFTGTKQNFRRYTVPARTVSIGQGSRRRNAKLLLSLSPETQSEWTQFERTQFKRLLYPKKQHVLQNTLAEINAVFSYFAQ